MKVRKVLTILAAAFSGYLAARGVFPTQPVDRPGFLIAGVVLYLGATILVLAVRSVDSARRDVARLPVWATACALAVSAAMPWVVTACADESARMAPHVTWYVGGAGALMTIVMVRRRPISAWTGIALLGVSSSILMGIGNALAFGLVGSFLWVGVGQLMQISTDRAYSDTVKLASLQQASAAWQSAQLVRRRERRERVQYALQVAAPVLTQVIASGGALTDEQRAAAWLAEGALRDELRGARLLDDDVRRVIATLREGGAAVTVLDEGGLDDLGDDALSAIRAELAQTLASADAGRIIIRTAPHPDIAVTIVGRAAAGGHSDEDAVALWHEIRRPAAS
ncbi:hypothetical protein GCM10017576_22710 [Microbacterium barkeri]|uniref:Uncharacterized protein n=1 Tax=Microbacterium barkeri TaxID=33917 RepID=A0A9W6LX77_9MICO|nr:MULTISPECIES: hypothetical protein [Microbacterium]MDR6876701.1 hypothetical protein [Microbacterium barkeri]WRH16888.1 hypothetical protein GC092_04695 [Microbacterium sp. JZ37]GLJ62141.1 hypothetical protein GCM10017576_22710 [Microbacterium barkeri]